ncbi:YdbL family protein [bacterium]|nr:YdbL family protein [bacterium]
MKARHIVSIVLMALVALASTQAMAASQADAVATLKQLQPALQAAKTKGTVGEVYTGFVDAVKSADAATQGLIGNVNASRKIIYAAVAKKHGMSPAKAGILMGQRHFKKAKPGEYLKGSDGKWRRK